MLVFCYITAIILSTSITLDCSQIKNLCDSNPCVSGTCVSIQNSWKCICPHNSSGIRCEKDNGPCSMGYCSINSNCSFVSDINQYKCSCHDGYVGDRCQFNVCEKHSCYHGGKCVVSFINGQWSPFCKCLDGFSGIHCELNIKCNANNCFVGTCIKNNSSNYKCECIYGYSGSKCSVPPNKCMENPCLNNQECIQFANGYQCFCMPPYIGEYCEYLMTTCEGVSCAYGGYCSIMNGVPTCNCINGWTGPDCSYISEPCSAVSNMKCLNNGKCTFDGQYYSCICTDDYIGNQCQYKKGSCLLNRCQNNSSCIEQNIGNRLSYKCECSRGFHGHLCQYDIDECKNFINICQMGGTCFNFFGGYTCINETQSNSLELNHRNTILFVCSPEFCKNGGTCLIGNQGAYCECISNYHGVTCSIPIDICQFDVCSEYGTLFCNSNNSDDPCICKTGYFGPRCDMRKICPCLNGGSCNLLDGSCICSPFYHGVYCHLILDEKCLSFGCNKGYCMIDNTNPNGIKCKCPNDYYGDHCQYVRNSIDVHKKISNVQCPDNVCYELPSCLINDQSQLLINYRELYNSCICNFPSINEFVDSNFCLYQLIDSAKDISSGVDCSIDSSLCNDAQSCVTYRNESRCLCKNSNFIDECIVVDNYKLEEACPFHDCNLVKNQCETHCQIPQCEFGGMNCTLGGNPWDICPDQLFCWKSFKDDICNPSCNNKECLFDGFDCSNKTCIYKEYCRLVYLNQECNEICNNEECLWDGGDCNFDWQKNDFYLRIIFETDINIFTDNLHNVIYVISSLLTFPVNIKTNNYGVLSIQELNSIDSIFMNRYYRSLFKSQESMFKNKLMVDFVTDSSLIRNIQTITANEAKKMISAALLKNKIDLPFDINQIEAGPLKPYNKLTPKFIYIGSIMIVIFLMVFIILSSLSFRSNVIKKTMKAKLIHANLPTFSYKNISMVEMVEDRDPSVSSRIPLMIFACSSDTSSLNSEIIKMQKNGLSLDIRLESSGLTALHMAVQQLNEKNALSLIHAGADPLVIDVNGRNAIHKAAALGFNVLLNHIFSRDHNFKVQHAINNVDNHGYTALIESIKNHHTIITSLLLLMKANTNFHDHEGRTSLHWAVISDNFDALEILLNAKTLIDVQDSLGQTPLHLAVLKESVRAVELLLTFNASYEIKDSNNQSVLDIINYSTNGSIINLSYFKNMITKCIHSKKSNISSDNKSRNSSIKNLDSYDKKCMKNISPLNDCSSTIIKSSQPTNYLMAHVPYEESPLSIDISNNNYSISHMNTPDITQITNSSNLNYNYIIDDDTAACLAADILNDIDIYANKFNKQTGQINYQTSLYNSQLEHACLFKKKRVE